MTCVNSSSDSVSVGKSFTRTLKLSESFKVNSSSDSVSVGKSFTRTLKLSTLLTTVENLTNCLRSLFAAFLNLPVTKKRKPRLH